MKLLLTGAFGYTDNQLKQLRALGHELVFAQDERLPLSEQGVDAAAIEGVVCNSLFLHNDISAFRNLRYIQLTSAGLDRVPVDVIHERNIKLLNARDVYSIPMAEFALCGVLQFYKSSTVFRENQRNHMWEKQRNLRELCGKTVCIVGCGSVGQACAKRFSAFDCHIIGVDITADANAHFQTIYPFRSLDVALGKSDVVILALPLTDQTKGLFDRKRLLCCRKDAVLVNVSRGGVIVQDDLIDLLNQGHFFGAVLDVFEQEPLKPDNPLWDMQTVILTPHNSFVGEGNNDRLFKVIIENLQSES